jgi:outer membrane protein assembly factor BamE (lipoprotein component of BamABCDE complex)
MRHVFQRSAQAAALALALAGCSGTQINPPPNIANINLNPRTVQVRGYVLQDGALEQVPVGSTKDQVQFVLGTPTTVSQFENETFYYITDTVERLPGMTPRIIDRRVIAISFDAQSRVRNIANYGLQDGRVFDFVSRTTPSGGRQTTFIAQLFQNLTR